MKPTSFNELFQFISKNKHEMGRVIEYIKDNSLSLYIIDVPQLQQIIQNFPDKNLISFLIAEPNIFSIIFPNRGLFNELLLQIGININYLAEPHSDLMDMESLNIKEEDNDNIISAEEFLKALDENNEEILSQFKTLSDVKLNENYDDKKLDKIKDFIKRRELIKNIKNLLYITLMNEKLFYKLIEDEETEQLIKNILKDVTSLDEIENIFGLDPGGNLVITNPEKYVKKDKINYKEKLNLILTDLIINKNLIKTIEELCFLAGTCPKFFIGLLYNPNTAKTIGDIIYSTNVSKFLKNIFDIAGALRELGSDKAIQQLLNFKIVAKNKKRSIMEIMDDCYEKRWRHVFEQDPQIFLEFLKKSPANIADFKELFRLGESSKEALEEILSEEDFDPELDPIDHIDNLEKFLKIVSLSLAAGRSIKKRRNPFFMSWLDEIKKNSIDSVEKLYALGIGSAISLRGILLSQKNTIKLIDTDKKFMTLVKLDKVSALNALQGNYKLAVTIFESDNFEIIKSNKKYKFLFQAIQDCLWLQNAPLELKEQYSPGMLVLIGNGVLSGFNISLPEEMFSKAQFVGAALFSCLQKNAIPDDSVIEQLASLLLGAELKMQLDYKKKFSTVNEVNSMNEYYGSFFASVNDEKLDVSLERHKETIKSYFTGFLEINRKKGYLIILNILKKINPCFFYDKTKQLITAVQENDIIDNKLAEQINYHINLCDLWFVNYHKNLIKVFEARRKDRKVGSTFSEKMVTYVITVLELHKMPLNTLAFLADLGKVETDDQILELVKNLLKTFGFDADVQKWYSQEEGQINFLIPDTFYDALLFQDYTTVNRFATELAPLMTQIAIAVNPSPDKKENKPADQSEITGKEGKEEKKDDYEDGAGNNMNLSG